MAQYAEGTSVPVARSRDEIERTLQRFGATGFVAGWDEGRAVVSFIAEGRQVRFVLQLPDRNADDIERTATGKLRSDAEAKAAYDKAVRQCWRSLVLVVKAKLEAVRSGLMTFEDEFLSSIVMPDGQTVGDTVRGQIALAYETGQVPALLPDYNRRAITGGA